MQHIIVNSTLDNRFYQYQHGTMPRAAPRLAKPVSGFAGCPAKPGSVGNIVVGLVQEGALLALSMRCAKIMRDTLSAPGGAERERQGGRCCLGSEMMDAGALRHS